MRENASFTPSGLVGFPNFYPTACAVGFILMPRWRLIGESRPAGASTFSSHPHTKCSFRNVCEWPFPMWAYTGEPTVSWLKRKKSCRECAGSRMPELPKAVIHVLPKPLPCPSQNHLCDSFSVVVIAAGVMRRRFRVGRRTRAAKMLYSHAQIIKQQAG